MGPPPTRERYNAKARGSVAGGSHKKRTRPKNKAILEGDDENDVDVVGVEQAAVEEQRDGRGKMSSKKRKRLDSYISKKLKLEERLKTLTLLSSLAPSSSISGALASSSTLGQNPLLPSSAMERMEKKEDKLVRRGIGRLEARGVMGGDGESDDDGVEEGRARKGKAKETVVDIPQDLGPIMEADTSHVPSPPATKQKNKTKSSKKASWNPGLLSTQPQSDSSSDFDSSDSDNDNLEEDEAGPSRPVSPQPTPSKTHTSPPETKIAVQSAPHAVTLGLGGALKIGTDGIPIQPRVIKHRQKMPMGRMQEDSEDTQDANDDEENEDGEFDLESDVEDNDDELKNDHSGNSTSDNESSNASENNDPPPLKKRSHGFKDWALKQMGQNASTPSSPKPEPPPFATSTTSKTTLTSTNHPHPFKPPRTGPFVGPLGTTLDLPSSSLLDRSSKSSARPTITRRQSISDARMELPILAEEQAIVEAIRMNAVVIIAGETGSGKTTQVPQMLYEAGFGYKGSDNPGTIAITQPRRVAAVSLSIRVRSELGFPPSSSTVAHQIRYSSTTSLETRIKFMTDGVLLRELSSDFLLSRYSVVVVDEAHERGVNTDVLIGVLSRVAKLREKKWRDQRDQRDANDSNNSESKSSNGSKDPMGIKPLRIVIMSATLRIEDFAQNTTLFSTPPPVIRIPARQHPVTIHFSRKTPSDYVTEAYKKVCKIHARLPQGGVLVFMTGQGEIQQLCRKLEQKYGKKKGVVAGGFGGFGGGGKVNGTQGRERGSLEEPEAEELELGNNDDLAADVDDGEAESDPEALDSEDDGLDLEIDEASNAPMHVLPLYSLLSNEQQMQVFRPPPSGHRLVIIATNVAETSLTIPGIRYVVDTGRSKERHYDVASGVQSFQISWISKASASQRTGRAGRTGPGHCYRLYSSALFEDHFAKFAKPEILRMPIEGVVLQMKSMNIDQVVNFPFPTPPDRGALQVAEKLLEHLGALERPTHTRMIGGTQLVGKTGGRITDLGKAMAGYPVTPRFAKMLVIGDQHDCLGYVIAIVACLSVGDPFLHEASMDEGNVDEDDSEEGEGGAAAVGRMEREYIKSEEIRAKEERKQTRRRYFKAQSQFLGLGGGTSDVFKMLAAVGAYEYDPTPSSCSKHFLRAKAMQEIQQLRRQISTITNRSMTRLDPPSDTQLKVLRQIITAASLDRIAVRTDIYLKQTTSYTSTRDVPYRAIGLGSEDVFIHPSSALFHRPPPEFLTFHEITRSSATTPSGNGKTWMKGITRINVGWLSTLGKSMCTFSKPQLVPFSGLGDGALRGGIIGKMGKVGKVDMVQQVKDGERQVVVVPHFSDLGVDLPPVRMIQRRQGTRWVLVE